VPDELAIRLVEGQLKSASCQGGFVLTGFPRTLHQAKALEWVLERSGMTLSAVTVLNVSEEQAVSRLAWRRVCEQDGRVYHLVVRPPARVGRCNECGGRLVSRRSDTIECLAQRIREYEEHAHAVREFYAGRGLLRIVDGSGDPESVYRDVLSALARSHLH
jgi:adenylate kinase